MFKAMVSIGFLADGVPFGPDSWRLTGEPDDGEEDFYCRRDLDSDLGPRVLQNKSKKKHIRTWCGCVWKYMTGWWFGTMEF